MPVKTNAGQILKAAGKVFHREGYHGAKVERITQEAGIAQGTFYLYFPSKERAFVQLMTEFAEKIRAVATDLDWQRVNSARDLREQIIDLYTRIFETCAADREVADLFFSTTASAEQQSAAIREAFEADVERIASRFLAAGVAKGFFRPVNVDTAARAIVAVLLYSGTRTIVAESGAHELRNLAEELVDLELRGLLTST